MLADDELSLREDFIRLNDYHESQVTYAQGGLFLAFLPLTYVLSRQVRPTGVLAFSLAYYFGVYRAGALNYLSSGLQTSLNNAAEPFALKYGMRKPDEYAQ